MGNARNIAFWVVLFLLVLALFNMFTGGSSTVSQSNEVSYSDFVRSVESDEVNAVTLDGEQIRFLGNDGQTYSVIKPSDAQITQLLIDNNVSLRAEQQQQSGFQTFILSLLPFLLLIGVWVYFMNRMQGGGRGGAMGFGKSKAKMLTEKQGRVTFDDVAGIDEAKEELEEIVEFLRNPQKFSRLGGKIPKGALLVGPPGTGKTLLARAIAGEAGVPFFHLSLDRILSKCLSALAQAAYAICSSRPKRMRPASCLSTRLTLSAAIAAPAMAGVTMSVNRR